MALDSPLALFWRNAPLKKEDIMKEEQLLNYLKANCPAELSIVLTQFIITKDISMPGVNFIDCISQVAVRQAPAVWAAISAYIFSHSS